MALESVEFLQGLFSLIFVIISTIVGIKILLKYYIYRQNELVFVGFCWIGMAIPWLPDGITLIMIIFFNHPLNEIIYFIIVIAFIPAFLLFWLIAITNFLYKLKQKLILIIYITISVIFEIIFFYLLLKDTSLIGTFLGSFQVEYTLFIQIYLLTAICIFSISGILFSRESLKSDNPEIKLKGKLLLAAIILFTIGAAIDAAAPLIAITVVLTRSILIMSAITFYCGFILPSWMRKFFLEEE
jgi:hypothetical protein